MKQRRWKQIESMRNQVLQLDNPEQQEKRCQKNKCKDQQLCNEVIDLLKHIHKAKGQGFLDNN